MCLRLRAEQEDVDGRGVSLLEYISGQTVVFIASCSLRFAKIMFGLDWIGLDSSGSGIALGG
jgi:hypothetical protein